MKKDPNAVALGSKGGKRNTAAQKAARLKNLEKVNKPKPTTSLKDL